MNFKSGAPTARQGVSLCLLISLLTLSSCGGSSSTTVQKNALPSPVADEIKGDELVVAPAGQEPTPAAELGSLPVVSVSQRHFSDPNVLLNLHGTVTAAPGATIVKTLWTQVTGPQVRIPSPLQLSNEIVIPDVNVATTLEFRLTAQDSNNKVNSATVSILVKPVPTFAKVVGGVFNETDRAAVFTLRLNAASDLPLTLSYVTQDNTATHGSDYLLTQGEVTFAAGEVTKTISVPLIDDTQNESDESFNLQVIAMDGQVAHANHGIAIIHSGVEPLLPQTISFTTPGAATLPLNLQYTNPLLASAGSGAVLYTSSNPQVATVDSTGVVTPLAQGATIITAIKAGDTRYLPAEISYSLQVVKSTAAPVVSIGAPQDQDGISLQLGETLFLEGVANDREDGIILYSAPEREVFWTSSIDGFLDYNAARFSYSDLSQGAHSITLSVTDSDGNIGTASVPVYVGNIAPLASIQDNTRSPSCNPDTSAINDSNLATLLKPGCGAEGLINLSWPSDVTINTIDLYSDPALPIQGYTIEYFYSSRESWTPLVSASSQASLYHSHPVTPITTRSLRIRQTQPGSINELVIYGRVDGSQSPTTPKSSAASSSLASSARASSPSSRASSSLVSSSLVSSSKASSSSSRASSSKAVASSSRAIIVL